MNFEEERQFIIDAVTSAKVRTVHPDADNTIDIGRAVLAAYKNNVATHTAPGAQIDLLPCPFCGSTYARVFNSPDEHGRESFGVQCGGSECAICGPERGSEQEAAEAWNRRVALARAGQQAGEAAGDVKSWQERYNDTLRGVSDADMIKCMHAEIEEQRKQNTILRAQLASAQKDAERYRWLRDTETDVSLVLDKQTGWVPPDENVPGIGGYHTYEYRAGEELDQAIDAARAHLTNTPEK